MFHAMLERGGAAEVVYTLLMLVDAWLLAVFFRDLISRWLDVPQPQYLHFNMTLVIRDVKDSPL